MERKRNGGEEEGCASAPHWFHDSADSTNSFSKFPLSLLFCDDVTVSSSERRKTATLMAS